MNDNMNTLKEQTDNTFLDNHESKEKITLYDLNSQKPIENMPYIYCPKCKNKIVANSKFCNSCGYKLNRR